MCLTIPKKVLEIKENLVVLEKPDGTRQEAKSMVELEVGDYVYTMQNVVIQKMDREEALQVLNLLKGGNTDV
jgi:hydrogenase maturation factor